MANSTSLSVTANGRRLRFLEDFKIEELDANNKVIARGEWESFSGENENELSYRLEGEPRVSLAARYDFNKRNQLQVQIPVQPGVEKASNTWLLQGKISIDDNCDLIYVLLDGTGSLTDRKIFVYGKLDFLKAADRLSVTFEDGRQAFILGNDGKTSLEASNFFQGGDLSRDLLWFDAVTQNELDGEDLIVPAEIQFVGRWDVYEGSLVLVTAYDATGSTPKAHIAIGGRIKGTNVGLVIEQNGAFAFQIQGKYQWNQNDLSWELNLGHSPNNSLKGKMAVAGNIQGKNGVLKFVGGLTLEKNASKLDLDLSLEIQYTAKWGSLDFRLQGNGQEYQIYFGGDVRINNGRVTFAIRLSKTGAGKKVEADFGFYTKDVGLKVAVESVLGRGGSDVKLKLKLNLRFAVAWGPNGLLEPV